MQPVRWILATVGLLSARQLVFQMRSSSGVRFRTASAKPVIGSPAEIGDEGSTGDALALADVQQPCQPGPRTEEPSRPPRLAMSPLIAPFSSLPQLCGAAHSRSVINITGLARAACRVALPNRECCLWQSCHAGGLPCKLAAHQI